MLRLLPLLCLAAHCQTREPLPPVDRDVLDGLRVGLRLASIAAERLAEPDDLGACIALRTGAAAARLASDAIGVLDAPGIPGVSVDLTPCPLASWEGSAAGAKAAARIGWISGLVREGLEAVPPRDCVAGAWSIAALRYIEQLGPILERELTPGEDGTLAPLRERLDVPAVPVDLGACL